MIDLINKGTALATKFVVERLVSGHGHFSSKRFYAALPMSGVKTMSDLKVPIMESKYQH